MSKNNIQSGSCRKAVMTLGSLALLTAGCSPENSREENNGGEIDTDTGKPNIILIMADDMGYGDISALNTASGILTPNLDNLCREGMRFNQAHAESALSTPSRYGIMTGQYCFRGPLKKGVLGGYSKPIIDKSKSTLPKMLKSAGYQTAVIGKWHLGLGWATTDGAAADGNNTDFSRPLDYSPNDIGFDRSYILPASLDMSPYVYVSDHIVEDREIVDEPGSDPAPYRGHVWRAGKASKSFDNTKALTHFTEESLNYIKEHADDEKPFFLYMPLVAPHTPWLASERFKGKSSAGDYGDYMLDVDNVVGDVMRTLADIGIKDNTIVIFTSDNGSHWNKEDIKTYGHKANYIWKGMKSDIWEGGHHIPLIIRYPALVRRGSSSDELVCLNDLYATLADFTGANTPAGAAEDSYSFLNALNGGHSERQEVVVESGEGYFGIIKGGWKYLDCSGSGGWSQKENCDMPPGQLYDIYADPGETENLYYDYPSKVTELKNLLYNIQGRD